MKARLRHEEREAEREVQHRVRRHERAKQRAQRDRGERDAPDHPDPRRRFERQQRERHERDRDPGDVAVDARVRLLRAEHADRVAPRRGVVRVRPDHERASAGPEAREVVLVHELDAAIERSGDDDERDTDEDSDEERDVRAALSSHAPQAYLLAPLPFCFTAFFTLSAAARAFSAASRVVFAASEARGSCVAAGCSVGCAVD